MSKADRMFKDLGYQIDSDGRYPLFMKGNLRIMFDMDDKTYSISEVVGWRHIAVYVDIKTHLAIHEKMKELGWLN